LLRESTTSHIKSGPCFFFFLNFIVFFYIQSISLIKLKFNLHQVNFIKLQTQLKFSFFVQTELQNANSFVDWIRAGLHHQSNFAVFANSTDIERETITKSMIECLVGFGVAQGSLSTLLSAVDAIMLCDSKQMSFTTESLNITKFIENLKQWGGRDYSLNVVSATDPDWVKSFLRIPNGEAFSDVFGLVKSSTLDNDRRLSRLNDTRYFSKYFILYFKF
jgi:hypothetical protein